jgi:hypothetical protein
MKKLIFNIFVIFLLFFMEILCKNLMKKTNNNIENKIKSKKNIKISKEKEKENKENNNLNLNLNSYKNSENILDTEINSDLEFKNNMLSSHETAKLFRMMNLY